MSDGWRTVDCTEPCWKIVYCRVCGKMKKPIGRDAPAATVNILCSHDCPGYREEPQPGHLWPEEKP